jgi:hypothetical protein
VILRGKSKLKIFNFIIAGLKNVIPEVKTLNQDDVLELLRIFDTEKFRGLEKNTGADAFRHFFKYELWNLGIEEVNDDNVKKTGKSILEKVKKINIFAKNGK